MNIDISSISESLQYLIQIIPIVNSKESNHTNDYSSTASKIYAIRNSILRKGEGAYDDYSGDNEMIDFMNGKIILFLKEK